MLGEVRPLEEGAGEQCATTGGINPGALLDISAAPEGPVHVETADSDSDSTITASDDENDDSADAPAELTQPDPEILASEPYAIVDIAPSDIEFSKFFEWVHRHMHVLLGFPAISSRDSPVLFAAQLEPPKREQVFLALSSDPAS